ncbi:YdcF family protein [Brevibacillus fluminis]|uniref:YdcF family protein n=1 Tax=Brevibacillus fluminis TaxID=511487 RepID=UPI003F8B508E
MKRLMKRILLGFLLWFSVHLVIITIDGLLDKKQAADVGVVLGNKVEPNGRPSDRLQSRLEKAAELYKEGYFPRVIVSGGVGVEGFDEAKVMKQYLVDKGLPQEAVIVDSQGLNTIMTAQNTQAIMKDLHMQSAMVITQFYHISRTKLAFHQAGIDPVYSAHADFFEWRDLYALFREFFAYHKYLLFQTP